ncbi:MAG TPA: hypothetical protein VN151_03395 [Terracidiphilus sp.]|nr:hypothetical protein [Terracidiphilus sp.]
MLSKLSFAVLLLAVSCAFGQSAQKTLKPATEKHTTSALPKTSPELAKVILGSYYHPDSLELIECDVSVDWGAFFQGLKVAVPEEKMQALKALKIHSRALRGKPAEVKFDWSEGTPATQDQIESGFKQMLGGFYQMYWPMMAGPLIGPNDRLEEITSLPDGGVKAFANSAGMKIHMQMNRNGAPTHYEFEGGMMKGVIDLSYAPSPTPMPGDLRRIESMKIDEHIGESSFKLDVDVDYQDQSGFSIPRDVTFAMLGAYTFKFQFAVCTASAVGISQ